MDTKIDMGKEPGMDERAHAGTEEKQIENETGNHPFKQICVSECKIVEFCLYYGLF